jgi:hypothetical protein
VGSLCHDRVVTENPTPEYEASTRDSHLTVAKIVVDQDSWRAAATVSSGPAIRDALRSRMNAEKFRVGALARADKRIDFDEDTELPGHVAPAACGVTALNR